MPAASQARTKQVMWWHVAVLVAITVVVYLDSFQNLFLWDDRYLIVENPRIKNWARLPELFSSDLFPQGVLSRYYRPVQALTYLLDYRIWGLDPVGFHLTNTLLHAGVVVLLYWFASLVLADSTAALITALLFAVHPIHTEAVTYIAGRSDPLMGLFVLASLIGFLHQRGKPPNRWGVLSLSAFAMALLAREAAMGMILLLVLVDVTVGDPVPAPCGAWPRRIGVRYLPYVAVMAGYLIVRHRVVGVTPLETALATIPLPLRLLTMARVVILYLGVFLVPVNLHMERWVEPARTLREPATWGSLLLIGGLVAAAVAFRRRAWPVTFGVVWFLVGLVPVANIVPLTTFMAEHWLYLPSMGLCLAAGWGLREIAKQGWEQAVAAGLVVIVAIYGGLTVRRNMDWRDGVTFYQATLVLAPHSARAWANLGYSYQELGRLDEAQAAYEEALRRRPGAADVVQNLGVIDAERGKPDEALRAYERAIAMDADFAGPYNNLGNILRAQGRLEEAVQQFRAALAIDPNHVAAHSNLGLTLEALGRSDEARAAYESAIRIDPDFAPARSNLGNFHFRRDELAAALDAYQTAVALDPDYAEAYNNLGSVYFRMGKPELAEAAYRRALDINPTLAEVRRNLAIVLQGPEERSDAGPTP